MVNVFIGSVIAIGNGLVLLVILHYKHLHTVTNFLIANLALADFVVGAIGVPCYIVNMYDNNLVHQYSLIMKNVKENYYP